MSENQNPEQKARLLERIRTECEKAGNMKSGRSR